MDSVIAKFRQLKLPVILSLLLVLLPAIGICASAEFLIFHTSDTHGAISSHPDPTAKTEPKPMMGGFAILKKLMDDYISNPEFANARILYFDSGDFFQGTPVVDRTKGAVMIDMMNIVGLDATTLGNHEFDYSYQNLIEQMQRKQFPVICCNVVEKATGKLVPFAEPYRIFTHNGFKVGVIGIDTPETPSISVAKNVKEIEFLDPEKPVEILVKKLRKAGVDFIILLSHLGYESDLKFVEKVSGIDLILGGHSHTLLSQITRAGPENTPIIHSGASLEHTSAVRILLRKDAPPQIEMKSHPLYLDEIGYDMGVALVEEEYLRDIRAEMARVLGDNEVNLYRGVNGGDSPEGSFIADAMRKAADTDFAFINFGGIRQPLFKGELNVESAFMVQPFDNKIEILSMTGTQILDLLERAVSNEFSPMDEADKAYAMNHFNIKADGLKRVVGPDYGYLYPSNLTITFDPSKEPMQRLVKVEIPGQGSLEPHKIYRVALNDFIAAGGDGFTNLKAIESREKTDILVRDALIKYIEELKVIEKRPEKRMFNLRLTEESLD